METLDKMNLKFVMEKSWYKEYWTFLMVPVLATVACYFIPLFRCEQGMSYMSILPLTTAFSYGHTLSPRRPYYEKGWQEIMGYHDFILASAKRFLLFAVPTALASWISGQFLQGYPKELALFFETSTCGLATGIFICAIISYSEETFKLRKTNSENYKTNLSNLWKWIILPMLAFSLLTIVKSYIFLNLLRGRP